jgi:ABC-2 type transport system permease protein
MFLRIVVLTPPMWQIALSILLLVLGILAVVWVAARVYRVGILMYGKRPTFPEIVRWVRHG